MPAYVTPICGTPDDTPEIQALLDAGVPIQLPAGVPIRISSLNMTNRTPVMVGCGILGTKIIPIQSGVNVLDLTGASSPTLRDFRIAGAENPSVIPSIGILSAFAATITADAHCYERVRVDGNFSLSSWYCLQVASSMMHGCQFYNYQPSAMTCIVTGNNFFGVASHFTTINNANSSVPSDWTLTQVEMHNFGQGQALWIGGSDSFRMYGGNISSSAIPISYNAVVINGVAQHPKNTIFDGTTFYSDFPPTPPRAIQANSPTTSIFLRANTSPFPIF